MNDAQDSAVIEKSAPSEPVMVILGSCARRFSTHLYTALMLVIAAVFCLGLLLLVLEFGLRLYYRAPIAERYYRPSPGPANYGLAPSLHYVYLFRGRLLQVSTDADGNRVTPGAPKHAEKTLYLIGDSQVFGWGLSDDETISAALQRRLGSSWRVVNMGVPGFGPQTYAEELSNLPAGSIAVVLQAEVNDFQDAYFGRSPLKSRCGYLVSPGFLGETAPCWVLSSYLLTKAIDVLIRSSGRLPIPLGYDPYAKIATRVLRYRIDNLYRTALNQTGDRVLFGAIPWDAAIRPERLINYEPVLATSERFVELPDACGLSSLFNQFAGKGQLFQKDDAHLSALGADLTASRLATLVPQLAGETTSEVWPESLR
jgi:hypothetical protein